MKMLWQTFMQNIKRGMVRCLSMWIGYQPKILWLGASLDSIVYDPTSNTPLGCLEIKCIECGKGMAPLETYLSKKEHESGKKKSFCVTTIKGNVEFQV